MRRDSCAVPACESPVRANRPSWDLVAAAYAVHGLDGPFALGRARGIDLDAVSGRHRWTEKAGSAPRRYLAPILPPAGMAAHLEGIIVTGFAAGPRTHGGR